MMQRRTNGKSGPSSAGLLASDVLRFLEGGSKAIASLLDRVLDLYVLLLLLIHVREFLESPLLILVNSLFLALFLPGLSSVLDGLQLLSISFFGLQIGFYQFNVFLEGSEHWKELENGLVWHTVEIVHQVEFEPYQLQKFGDFGDVEQLVLKRFISLLDGSELLLLWVVGYVLEDLVN